MNHPQIEPTDRRFLADQACKYLNYLTHFKTASDHTSKSYANDLSQFLLPQIEGRILYAPQDSDNPFQIEKMTKSDAQNCRSEGQSLDELITSLVHDTLLRWSPLSAASRNRKFTVLRGFLTWLHENDYIEKDWRTHLVGPKVPQKIPDFLSLDEVLALFKSLSAAANAPSEGGASLFHLVLTSLLYGGGLRVSEACSLKWADLDSIQKTARILGKGNKERLVALPDLVWRTLERVPQVGIYIFGDSPLDTRKAYEWIRQAGRSAGLYRPLHPHTLRHSYATHLLSSGTDLRVLQELLGHKSLTATQKYTHLSMDHLARSLETFHPLSASKLKKPAGLD